MPQFLWESNRKGFEQDGVRTFAAPSARGGRSWGFGPARYGGDAGEVGAVGWWSWPRGFARGGNRANQGEIAAGFLNSIAIR